MPKFKYTAMDAKGREVQEIIDAESQAKAVAGIRERGLFPTTVTEVGGGSKAAAAKSASSSAAPAPAAAAGAPGRAVGPAAAVTKKGGLQTELRVPRFLVNLFRPKVGLKTLMVFSRQFATLHSAGLPLLRGLHILQKQEPNSTMRNAISTMAESVENGSTFAEAVAQHPRIFDFFFVNMVRAGEASGALETVLTRLAEHMEKSQKIRNKIKGAMVYPVVVLIIAMVILGVLMVFVIPKFKEIFADMLGDTPLPLLTRFVLNISETVTQKGLYVIGAIAGLVILVKMLAKTRAGSEMLDRFKLSAPIFGNLLRKSAIAQFTSTLGTLLTGGVPMLSALNIVRDIAGNKVLIRAIQQVHDSVKEGETVAGPLEASGVFPSMVVSMIQVGEETGALPDMLMRIASNYEDEVDTAVDALTSIIEPILIIFLAVIVGTIVIAMFMPLISIVGNLSG